MDAAGAGAVHKDGLHPEGLGLGRGQRQRQVHEGVKLAGSGIALGTDQCRLQQALQSFPKASSWHPPRELSHATPGLGSKMKGWSLLLTGLCRQKPCNCWTLAQEACIPDL